MLHYLERVVMKVVI